VEYPPLPTRTGDVVPVGTSDTPALPPSLPVKRHKSMSIGKQPVRNSYSIKLSVSPRLIVVSNSKHPRPSTHLDKRRTQQVQCLLVARKLQSVSQLRKPCLRQYRSGKNTSSLCQRQQTQFQPDHGHSPRPFPLECSLDSTRYGEYHETKQERPSRLR
jgi:hypothetical protein